VTKAFVSACLIGRRCRYNGKDELQADLTEALRREGVQVVAFCPEEAGGLPTPRPPAHLVGGDGEAVVAGGAKVVTDAGADVTEAFLEGARQAVARARLEGCGVAYLKERSPSCGCACVHTENGLVAGCGVTTALLRRAGIATISVA
jgi:uncharacterized protein YbbK (DUF523 family)